MKGKRAILAGLVASAGLLASGTIAGAASPWEQADVVGQGMGGPTVAPGGAKILRTADGLSVSLSMPTPVPGSYAYPVGPTATGEAGHPEAFSLWAFLFFNPEACDGDCDAGDLMTNPDVVAAAFHAGRRLLGGPHLTPTRRAHPATP